MAGTVQPLLTKASTVPAAATRFGGWPAVLVQFLSTSDSVVPWAVAGSFGNFGALVDVAPGVGNARIFAFTNITTSATTVVTVSGTDLAARETGSTLAVSPGDLLECVHTVTGTPAAIGSCELFSEFTGTNDNETGYCMHHVPGNGGLTDGGAPYYVAGPMCGVTFNTTTPPVCPNIIAIDGAITALVGRCGSAPGAGKSWDFYLVLSTDGGATWVLQDGSGGTVNTKCSVAGTTTPAVAIATFTLPVLQGYMVYVTLAATGTANTMRPGCAIRFLSTVPGESMVIGRLTTGPSSSATNYGFPVYATGGYNATEALAQEQWTISTFTLDQMRVGLATAPGASKSRTLSPRRNSSSPAGVPTVTISDTATTGFDSTYGSLILADLDLLSMRAVPSGTPASTGTTTWTFRARLGAYLTTSVAQPPMWPLPQVGYANPVGWIHTQPLEDTAGNPIIPPVWPAPAAAWPMAQGWIQTLDLSAIVVNEQPFSIPLWPLPAVAAANPVGWIHTQPLEDAPVVPLPPGIPSTPMPAPAHRAQLLSVMPSRLDWLAPPPAPTSCEMPVPPDSGGGTGEP